MRVNVKILLLFIGMFVLSLSGFVYTWQYQQGHLEAIQNLRIKESKNTFGEVVALKSKALNGFVFDNSYWDEMVSFLETHDDVWAHTNLVDAMKIQGYDYVAVFDNKKNIVFYHQDNDEEKSIKDALPRSTIKMKEPRFSHYFLEIGGKFVEIFSAPIQPSNDARRRTSPRGYLVIGKILDQEYVSDFSKMTSQSVEIVPLGHASFAKYDFFYPLKSYDENVIAHLGIKVASTTLDTVNQVFKMQFYILLIVGLVTIGFASMMIYMIVMKPLKTISHMIIARDSTMVPICMMKKDEFSEIAQALEELFKKEQQLIDEKVKIETALQKSYEAENGIYRDEDKETILDLAALKEVIGSQKLTDKFLRKFFEELTGQFADLPHQIANRKIEASALLHTLKGMSGNMRAHELHSACHVIDEKYKTDELIVADDIEALQVAIDKVKDKLRNLGHEEVKSGQLSGVELHELYDEIKNTLFEVNTVLPEKQRLLIAHLKERVDPNELEAWDWALCELEYEKAYEMMLGWNIDGIYTS